jgi:hypothetical protein
MRSPTIAFFAALLILVWVRQLRAGNLKTNQGNLKINILPSEGLDPRAARIYIDDIFIGTVSNRIPILHLKRGKHLIKVELDGAETYTESITILGDPNHQVLNVAMNASEDVRRVASKFRPFV